MKKHLKTFMYDVKKRRRSADIEAKIYTVSKTQWGLILYEFTFKPIYIMQLESSHESDKYSSLSFVTSKKRNLEFANSPIHEFKVLQNAFKLKTHYLK